MEELEKLEPWGLGALEELRSGGSRFDSRTSSCAVLMSLKTHGPDRSIALARQFEQARISTSFNSLFFLPGEGFKGSQNVPAL